MAFPSIPEIALIVPKDREISLYDHARDSPSGFNPKYPYGKTRVRFQDMDLNTTKKLCQRITLSSGADFLEVGGKNAFETGGGNGSLQTGIDMFVMWPLDGRVEKVSMTLVDFSKAFFIVEEDCLTIALT